MKNCEINHKNNYITKIDKNKNNDQTNNYYKNNTKLKFTKIIH